MTTAELTSFIGIRAEQLAYLVLTRRDDISVARNQRLGKRELDLTVTLLEDGHETGQLLAVEVKGVRSDTALRRFKNDDFSVDYFTFPLVLFVFNMENDEGYWRWLVEPLIGLSERPGTIRVAQTEALEPLTNEAVGAILDRVRRWYEARLPR